MKLEWKGEHFPPDQQMVEMLVKDDLADMEIEHPEDLIMHMVFLSEEEDGPAVLVEGGDGDTFVCHYLPKPGWVEVGAHEGKPILIPSGKGGRHDA